MIKVIIQILTEESLAKSTNGKIWVQLLRWEK